MAGQVTSKTSTSRVTARGDAKTTSDVAPTPTTPTPTRADPPTPQRPAPSPRTGVLVNVESVESAFTDGVASQSVGYVQHVLRSRGLDPGEPTGIATAQTRDALAKFQETIGEPITGLPTARTLDYLGFDVT